MEELGLGIGNGVTSKVLSDGIIIGIPSSLLL